MGTVFAARDLRDGREVAVKVLAAQLDHEIWRARFEREAEVLGQLRHPHIVALLEAGETDEGEQYLVMERVKGPSLAQRLPLPEAEAVAVAMQVCEAVGHAHHHGVVHRDLKPENVLLDEAGQVKVADFGIARTLRAGPPLTQAGEVLGTPDFIAPEVREGAAPDARADVFSLGVLIHLAVTGRVPRGTLAGLSASLAGVVRRALSAEASERFADAAELGEALRCLGTPELRAVERTWVRVVALALSLATAVSVYAVVTSLSPKVLDPSEVGPLVSLATEPTVAGQVISRVRFEVWPVLAAALAWALALGIWGVLQWHWRSSGLERTAGPAATGRLVLAAGALQAVAYALHRAWSGGAALRELMPVIGGGLGLWTVWLFWISALETWRGHRPLWRAWRPWCGVALAAVPSVSEFAQYLARWAPPR